MPFQLVTRHIFFHRLETFFLCAETLASCAGAGAVSEASRAPKYHIERLVTDTYSQCGGNHLPFWFRLKCFCVDVSVLMLLRNGITECL